MPRVTYKGSGEGGTIHTWWMQQLCHIFGRGDASWHMILGDNPAGHASVRKGTYGGEVKSLRTVGEGEGVKKF